MTRLFCPPGRKLVSIPEQNLPLKMMRATLDNVPEFALPNGFSLRWYQPGDDVHWLWIHAAADRYNEITSGLFQKQFRSDEKVLSERQTYLLDPHGRVIGTGTAWFNEDFEGARWGRVHWMAIVPQYQGQGLSKPLMTVICTRLHELGDNRAYLSTSSVRTAAIRLYLRFGFAPIIRSTADEAVWSQVLAGLR